MGSESVSEANVHGILQQAEHPAERRVEAEDDPHDGDNIEYPSGFKLVVVLVAIFLSLVLTGLVRSIP